MALYRVGYFDRTDPLGDEYGSHGVCLVKASSASHAEERLLTEILEPDAYGETNTIEIVLSERVTNRHDVHARSRARARVDRAMAKMAGRRKA